MPLVKQADGSFELTVPLSKEESIFYKYVVDGAWLVNYSQKVGHDNAGIENNILDKSDLVAAEGTQSKIPEAGGLAFGAGGSDSGVKTTVLPSTEGQQTTLGEPGIFVPKDPEALAAFETVRDVDPKTLNEPEVEIPALTAEEKKKQKKKLKRSQYKAKKKEQKLASASSATDDTSGVEPSPTPEPGTLDPAVVGAVGAAGLAAAVGAGAVGAIVTASAGAVLAGSIAHSAEGAESVAHPTVDNEILPGGSADIPGSATQSSVPVPETDSKDIAESVPESAPVAEETVPVVVDSVPETAEASSEKVIPGAIAAEGAPLEVSTAKDDVVPTIEPAIKEPIENTDLAATSAPLEEPQETPAVSNTVDEPAPVSKSVEATPVEAEEVHAVPVPKTKPAYDSEDEIIIAQGGSSAKEVEAKLAASDIDVEEIKPTASEAKRLAEEAHIPDPSATAAGKAATKPPTTTTAKNGKKDEKKKSGFISKFKKLFK